MEQFVVTKWKRALFTGNIEQAICYQLQSYQVDGASVL